MVLLEYSQGSVERHGIAEALAGIGDAAAVKADVLRVFSQLLDFLEHVFTRQHAEMAWMVSGTDVLFHVPPDDRLN